MSTSSELGGAGIFAKLVARFLVRWIRKTITPASAGLPALSATPSEVTGRPERNRGIETAGAHAGSAGARAAQTAPKETALQDGNFGAHRGVTTSARTPTNVTYDPSAHERERASMWNSSERQARADALRAADSQVLRDAGMNERQVAQAGNGRVPSGYQMEKVPANSAEPTTYQLSPTSAQAQHDCNAVTHTVISFSFSDVSIISLPIGGRQVTIVLGGGAALAV